MVTKKPRGSDVRDELDAFLEEQPFRARHHLAAERAPLGHPDRFKRQRFPVDRQLDEILAWLLDLDRDSEEWRALLLAARNYPESRTQAIAEVAVTVCSKQFGPQEDGEHWHPKTLLAAKDALSNFREHLLGLLLNPADVKAFEEWRITGADVRQCFEGSRRNANPPGLAYVLAFTVLRAGASGERSHALRELTAGKARGGLLAKKADAIRTMMQRRKVG